MTSADWSGLDLALGVVVLVALRRMDYRQVRTAAAGFPTFSALHLLFHVTHLAGFGGGGAVGLVIALVLGALLPLALLVLARRVRDQRLDLLDVGGNGFR